MSAGEAAQSGAALGGGEGGGGGAGGQTPLVGNVGQEYVQTTLSTADPLTAIRDIQARTGGGWVGGWVGGWAGWVGVSGGARPAARAPRVHPPHTLQHPAHPQARGALQDPHCRPLLGLLDQLGLSRAEAHRHVLQVHTVCVGGWGVAGAVVV